MFDYLLIWLGQIMPMQPQVGVCVYVSVCPWHVLQAIQVGPA